MIDMEKLKFDEKGLIPAIVVDGKSGQVLTLAYMNKESLEISIKEERTCFWSRSRQELWRPRSFGWPSPGKPAAPSTCGRWRGRTATASWRGSSRPPAAA